MNSTSRRKLGRLSEIGELAFLEHLRERDKPRADVELGIGDDCAVVRIGGRRLLVTTDALVEKVHFRWRWQKPAELGRRAFAVNASDIAAMGGRPRFAVLSLALPPNALAADLAALIRGFAAAARAAGCALVGGNLSSGPAWMISATLLGEPCGGVILTRAGARPGDLVYVSGVLGAAAFGREILLGKRRGSRRATRAFLRPKARLDIAELLSSSRAASAAIDVSDGLLADLGHLCRASGVGAVIDAAQLPLTPDVRRLAFAERSRLAATGGEDYEIAFTIPPRRAARLESEARRRSIRLSRIGVATSSRGVRLRGLSSAATTLARAGHDHFRAH